MRCYPLCLYVVLLLVLCFGTLAVASDPAAQPAVQSANEASTVWGGEHVEMEVTKTGATLEFDCATGEITEPLAVDSQGKFRVNGTFTREVPGPTRREGNPVVAATYSGSIEGETMHLTIVAGPNKEGMGDYVLVRGKAGRVMRCK